MKFPMKISQKGMKFLALVEGKKNRVYPDSGGEPTIGVGHLLTKSERSSGKLKIKDSTGEVLIIDYRTLQILTDEQVNLLLLYDLVSVIDCVNTNVHVGLTQYEFDTLVSFTFNVGNDAFINSTLLKLLNDKKHEQVPYQLRRWNRDKGKIVKGLITRRERECALWTGNFARAFAPVLT